VYICDSVLYNKVSLHQQQRFTWNKCDLFCAPLQFLWPSTQLATEQRRSLLLLSSSLYVVNCCKPNKIVHIYCNCIGKGEGFEAVKGAYFKLYTLYLLMVFLLIRLYSSNKLSTDSSMHF
jgi:hypothetical protein